MKIDDRIDRKTIVETIDRVEEWISKNGLKKMSRTKLTMTLEEILLSYMEKLGTATTFEIDMVRRNGDIRLKLTVPGEAFNPFSSESYVLEHFKGTYDAPPRWTHEDGVNIVRLLTNLAGYLANKNYNKVYNITLSNLEDDLVDGALGITKTCLEEQGTVLIDGLDIRTLDHDTIRSNIAVVTQQPYIFNMSIRENLCIVRPDLTDEEMADVCKKACIYDEIMSMPKGFDTVIGEGGTNISGGQCQRIAIARALIRNSRILLLDEATSALDNITQIRIQKAIENLHGDRTVIVIAHRLSTIINADVIFFIEDGRILDSGTHKELMESCASYRSLYGCETV